MAVRETALHLVEGIEGHARAFIQVQNGCDHRCTFCIIPFGRGNSRSVPMGEVVDAGAPARRERLSRGRAHRRRHHELRVEPARRAAARHAGAADPAARAGARTAAHLVDRLGRGRRRPARCARRRAAPDAASASLAAAWRRPDPQAHEAAPFARRRGALHATRCGGCAPTSCSAPTSSRASRPRPTTAFARSRDLVAECGLTHLHVFPYSARPGTPAARMPQVPHPRAQGSAPRCCARTAQAALRRHLEAKSARAAAC